MKNYNSRSFVLFALTIVLPLLILITLNVPYALALALFISVIILWFTELIPIAVTGFLIPVLASLYGILPPELAFNAFGNEILFLFIGSFIIAKAMQKHGLDKRMAYTILGHPLAAKSLGQLAIVISLLAWFLSMWISNTAACAIITPMALGILSTLENTFTDQEDYKKYSNRILILCAFSSSVGGMATPVGSPPNLLAIQFLADKGIEISFFNWMLFGLPISLIMLLFLNFYFLIKSPVKEVNLSEVQKKFKSKLKDLGSLKSAEIQVAFCFTIMVFLWLAPGFLKFIFPSVMLFNTIEQHLSMGVVSLAVSILLFILPTAEKKPNLVWSEAATIDWGTIILFGGGLTLGAILGKTGLAQTIGTHLFSQDLHFILLGGLCVLVAILISEFSSNTASAVIIIPILLGTFLTVDVHITKILVVATAFGASFGFMLPVSTPPNAIVYGTGKIALKEMIKAGIVFDIAGCLMIVFFILIIFPRLGII